MIDGREINFQKSKQLLEIRKNYMGYIVQNFALISRKSVMENLLIPVEGLFSHAEKKKMIANKLEELGISDKKWKYPSQLSNGEKQRVAIARALLGNKKILLADEPTGALDRENADMVIALLKTFAHDQQMTILVVTHDIEIAKQCDSIINLSYGRITSS
jgi:putative ABC transport system ATP-binding protein